MMNDLHRGIADYHLQNCNYNKNVIIFVHFDLAKTNRVQHITLSLSVCHTEQIKSVKLFGVHLTSILSMEYLTTILNADM